MVTQPNITQKLIDQGVPGDAKCCPVALAIRLLVKDDVSVTVGNRIWLGRQNDSMMFFYSPEEVSNFINAFDRIDEMLYDKRGPRPEPFSFPLDIPEEYLK